MPRPVRLPLPLLVLALGVGLICGHAEAASTSITINATIIEVQCTPAQRLRIRACATGQESFSTEVAKTFAQPTWPSPAVPLVEQRYEVRRDTGRKVVVKTVLY